MTVCKIDECEASATARGWCNPHYQAWYRHGSPTTKRNLTGVPVAERLMGQVSKLKSGCWEWTGKTDKDGYGKLHYENRSQRAHRLSYQTFVGPIPDGKVLRHTCDNPPCIKPSHLVPGSVSDNVWDMIRRNPDNPLLKGGKVSGAAKRAKDVCGRGHAFDEQNTYWRNEIRQCKTCRYDAWKRWYQRSKENA